MEEYSLASEGLFMSQCPRCSFIFDFPEDENTFCCPNCGQDRGLNFGFYPSITAIDLLYSLNDLATFAHSRQKAIVNILKDKISEITSRDYHFNTIYKITEEHVKSLNGYSINANSAVSLSGKIADILSLEDEHIDKVAHEINGDHINRLCKSIVILAASFIEIMFKDYMEEAIKRRTDGSIAANILSILENKSIAEHISQLDAFIGSDFNKDIDKVFYSEWMTIKGDRNKLMHKNSIYIHWERTKEIIETARASVKIFAGMRNKLLNSTT